MKEAGAGRTDDVVGLDWSDGVVTASRVEVDSSGALRLLNVGWASVGSGATDRELATAIRDVWRSASMPSWTVAVSLRSRSVILRYFNYPSLQPEELQSALRLEAEESLQLPQDEIATDVHLNRSHRPARPEATGQPYEGLLVAAPRKEVRHHLDVLRMAGLYPVAMDLGATALANLFQVLTPDPKQCEDTCVLHLSSHSADIIMLFEGDGLYARTLHARGGTWDNSVAGLVEGLQDALKFYVFKLRGQPVRRIVVTGRLPLQQDFLDVLRLKTGVPVELWNPLSLVKPASFRVQHRLTGASPPPLSISMGLSLRRYEGD
jgi:Tfp pilus assembly PilM family ATPase